MNSLITRTLAAQQAILMYSQELKQGVVPSITDILSVWAELVDVSMTASNYLSDSFSGKEHANIARKVAQAKNYISFRQKLSGVDSTNESIHSTAKEMKEEADSMVAYERCKILLKSIDNALTFLQSLQARIAQMETRNFTPHTL